MHHPDHTHVETLALHHRIDNAATRPLATPIYQNSAFTADSPYFYTRKANPNSVELEGALALLEQARHAISVSTGMAAINLVLQLLRPGQHLVINRLIYGCSYKLFQRHAEHFQIKITMLDLSDPAQLAQMPDDVAMVLFETPTNPFLKSVSIRAVADCAKTKNPKALVVVDNTWASPLFQHPLQHGADISLASATKYLSGHSDVMGGVVLLNDEVLADTLRQNRFYSGAILDPNSAWLLRRSLHTLPLRMREHVRITQQALAFLRTRKEIATIYTPEIDGKQLLDYGGIIFFQLAPQYAAHYTRFRDALEWFDTGTGMACVGSMVAQPWSGSHASLQDNEKIAMGINPGLVRLCFGLEFGLDLCADLAQALDSLHHG